MNKQIEALKMAIEFIEMHLTTNERTFIKRTATLEACKEALAQPQPKLFLDLSNSNGNHPVQQEPVAWRSEGGILTEAKLQAQSWISHGGKAIPLYTHPAPSWQGLSKQEVDKLYADWERGSWNYNTFADAIEQALKEKNT